MGIRLADAIELLSKDLLEAMDKRKPGLVLQPGEIELELGVTFESSGEVGGGIKAYVFDFSSKVKGGETDVHRIKIKLTATDDQGAPIKLSSDDMPSDI